MTGVGLTHRLRGHRLRKVTRHVDTSIGNAYGGIAIESGRIDHLLVCSCGESWRLTLVNPLADGWEWLPN